MDRKPGLQQRAKVKGVSNADPLLEQLYEEHRRQFPEKKREALDNAHADWAACKLGPDGKVRTVADHLTAVTQRIQELRTQSSILKKFRLRRDEKVAFFFAL